MPINKSINKQIKNYVYITAANKPIQHQAVWEDEAIIIRTRKKTFTTSCLEASCVIT